MIINVSILIDIDTTDVDIEDLRDVLLDEVVAQANTNPEIFTLVVYVAFKFDGVDPDSDESCETMQIGFDADACWVENAVLEKKEV
jgi:hypothetical protein